MTLLPEENKNKTDKTIRTVYSPHPILPAKNRQEFHTAVEGQTLFQLIETLPINSARLDVHAYVNDNLIPRGQWMEYTLKEGDTVSLKQAVRGGDDSNPLQIILMIVVVVAAFYTGQYWAVEGVWGMASYVGYAAVMVGGMLLVNAMFPVKLPDTSGSQEQSYTLQGTRNQARLYSTVPIVVGSMRMYPDLAAKPYIDQTRNDTYLNQVFNFGPQGSDIEVANVKIGDTNLLDYEGVRYQFSDANGAITLFPGNVDSVSGAEIKQTTGWVQRTTSANTTKIGVDISGSLFKTNNEGGIEFLTVKVEVQISPVGANTWTAFTGTNPYANTPGNRYRDEIIGREDRFVQDRFGQIVGQQFTGGSTYSTGGVFTLTHNKTKQYRWSIQQDVDPGQYDVRVRRITEEFTDNKKQANLTWAQLKSYQQDTGDYSLYRRLAVRIRASGQLNGTVDALNAEVSTKIPVWNGSGWVSQTSSNPAYIFLYLARGARDSNSKRLWGAGLADSRIDIDTIKEWGAWCDSHGLECNFVFQNQASVYEMLTLVARCGRASVSFNKGVLGIVYDKENLPVTQVFGPGNIIADSFSVSYLSKNLADQVIVKFKNEDLGWQEDEVRVTVANTNGESPVEIEAPGVTSVAQATKEANLLAARQYYHRRRLTFETDAEGLMVSRGDVIAVSHDLTSWGQGGRLSNYPTGNNTVLHLDRDIEFTSSNTYYIGCRAPDGTYEIKQCVNPYAGSTVTANSVTVTSAFSFNPYADPDNMAQDYLFAFDYSATPGKKFKVTSIMPSSEQTTFKISAIDEVDAYYDAENNSTTYTPPDLINQANVTITNVNVAEEFQGYDRPLKIYVTWESSQAIGAKVEVSVNGGAWQDYGDVIGNEFEFDVTKWNKDDLISINLTPIIVDLGRSVTIATYDYNIRGLVDIVEDINLPRITGLEIFGQGNSTEFTGKDAVFVWRKVQSEREEIGSETLGAETGTLDPYFQDYEVQIYSSDGATLLRTEYTTDEKFEYTWEKNSEDNGGQAVRSFRIYVRYRSKTNQVGLPAVMNASNPAPAAPNPTVSTILRNLYVQAQRPADIDVGGMEVHVASDSPSFTPNANTLIHRGPEASATIDAGLSYGGTYYVKVGFSDGFSNSAVNFSTANTVVPTELTDTDIQVAINGRLGLLSTDAWVDPPTANMGYWSAVAGDPANSSVNVTSIGPYNTTSPTLSIVGDDSANGWYTRWNNPFDIVNDRAYISYTWVKKLSANTDRGLYIGFTQDANSVADLNGTGNATPWFIEDAGATLTADKWYLAVGVLQANTASSNTNASGLYDPDTGLRIIESADFKHLDGIDHQHINFGFYSNTTAFANTDGFLFAAPACFAMDGGQPSIESLLRRSYQQGALASLDEISLTEFASGIEPVQVVSTLPASNTGNSNTVLLTSDSKLYRWNGSAYIATVANTDFTGEIIETQIANNAISTPKLQANSVTANALAANAVTATSIAADAVTAGKIAAGAVSADQIAANAITASKLNISGLGMALNKDPTCNINSWYATIGGSSDSGLNPLSTYGEFSMSYGSGVPVGTDFMLYNGSTRRDFSSDLINVDATKVYRITIWVKRQNGAGTNYLTAAFFNATGQVTTAGTTGFSNGTYCYWGVVNAAFPTGWTKYTVVFGPGQDYTMPTDAKKMRLGALLNYNNTASSQVLIADYRIEEVVPGELIVDGAITAEKITVANLSSMNADMGAISAGTIALDSTGWIRSGATDYGSGTGFWLGKDGATSKLYIGSPTKHLKWTGSSLNISGTIQSTNFVSGSAGYRLLDSGNAELNDVTVRGSLIANTGNTANVRIEVDPSSNFIMWAGTGTKDANTSNAVYYLRANGQAYFGGDIQQAFKPRAWCRFYGKTTGAFITRQYNIATIVRLGIGRYRFTFEEALANPYYCCQVTVSQFATGNEPLFAGAYSLSNAGFTISIKNAGGNYRDSELGSLIIFGSDEVATEPPPTYDPWTWDDDFNIYPKGTQIP